MEDKNTRKLVRFYRTTKSRKAKEILILNHQGALKLAASKTPNNIMEFSDKVQFGNEILMDLINKSFDLRRRVTFNTHLIHKTNFRIIDQIRKITRKRKVVYLNEIEYPIVDQTKNIDETLENNELSQLLVTEIQNLPRTEQVIMGCLHQGMSQNEIAEQCGVSIAYISIIVNRSKRKLKIKLSQ